MFGLQDLDFEIPEDYVPVVPIPEDFTHLVEPLEKIPGAKEDFPRCARAKT